MRILMLGAGVIGSVYAARIYHAGRDITLLARGKRYEEVNRHGIMLHDILNHEDIIVRVPTVNNLNSDDLYDLIIVTVRLDQLERVKVVLKNHKSSSLIMFMLNYPDNLKKLAEEFPDKKILAGFPGIGGTFEGNKINYVQIRQQKTTLGQVNNLRPEKIKEIKEVFEDAGFQVSLCSDMQSWLVTHAVFICCVSAAILRENGDSIRLGKDRPAIRQMILSIREGFLAIENLHISVTPPNLKTIFLSMPLWFAIIYWQRAMKGRTGTLAIAPHVHAGKEEIQVLAEKVLTLVHSSTEKTPVLDSLLGILKR